MSTHQWMASIPYREAILLHALMQKLAGKLLLDGDVIWLRGEVESEEALSKANQLLKEIPGAERFRLIENDRLQPFEQRLPTRLIPEGKWQSSKDLLSVQFPPAGLAGSKSASIPIRVVRGSSAYANANQTPSILECEFTDFCSWVAQTSEARLEFLSFACNRNGSVIVYGHPLPSLPGTTWIQYGNIAIPVGFSWQPSVSVKTLNEVLGPQPDSIHFFGTENHRVVHLSSLVKVTRSSVRQTAAAIGAIP